MNVKELKAFFRPFQKKTEKIPTEKCICCEEVINYDKGVKCCSCLYDCGKCLRKRRTPVRFYYSSQHPRGDFVSCLMCPVCPVGYQSYEECNNHMKKEHFSTRALMKEEYERVFMSMSENNLNRK